MQSLSEQSGTDGAIADLANVAEFCRRYRLGPKEERRLRNLLGEFAPQQQLLMTARRDAHFG